MGIPHRLVQAMAEINGLPEDVGHPLAAAILNSFGDCMCQKHVAVPGSYQGQFIALCDGHAFLMEDDARCTRIQHLLFARAQRGRWLAGEFGAAAMLQQALDAAGV
jgi:hypothetical protein